MALLEKDLATSAVIRSNPGDFLRLYFEIVNFTSPGEKCLTAEEIGRGITSKRFTMSVCEVVCISG
jgi:hypothetical protein